MKAFPIIIASLLFSAGPALADCNLSLAPITPVQRSYDPFSAVGAQLDFTLAVANSGSEQCSGALFLKPTGGDLKLVGPAASLAYDFSQPSGITPGSLIGPIAVTVPAGDTREIVFSAEIGPGSVVAPGDYDGEILIDLEQGGAIVAANRVLALSVAAQARAQMSISGTAAPGRGSIGMAPPVMDFGILETGESQTVFINVWANSSVKVSLSSEGHGRLLHQDDPTLPAISYSARFDNQVVALAGTTLIDRTPPLSIAGASYPLTVVIGDVSGHFSGQYSDVISITVDEN